eukprot:jgi/Tetstr1/441527/TSEL_029757.t1
MSSVASLLGRCLASPGSSSQRAFAAPSPQRAGVRPCPALVGGGGTGHGSSVGGGGGAPLRPSDMLEADTNGSGAPLRPSDLLDAPSGADTKALGSSADSVDGGEKGSGDYWDQLLVLPEDIMRAKSATDASMLRRKGHLKEQDFFIEFITDMHSTHTCAEVMSKMDRWIREHTIVPEKSTLKRLIPTIGPIFLPLNLTQAFLEYDEHFALSRRKYITPNFAEIRHILGIAQVHSSANKLKLITFDADGTLYADGHHFDTDNAMIEHIITLMRSGIEVAIVTAAGYPGQPEKFEMRVQGLLDEFKRLALPESIIKRFHIMGGECNYLVRVVPDTYRLECVHDEEWKSEEMKLWQDNDIKELLDSAESLLREGASRLRLPVQILRKERAVGIVPRASTVYEVLEDLAITVHTGLIGSKVPYCAFNGGNDVFVDIGNKNIGLKALQKYFDAESDEVLHVGDRFTASGNDSATRECCSILWVASPEETSFFMKILIGDIRKNRSQRYLE